MPIGHITEERVAAFWSNVNRDGPTDPVMGTNCWLWTGAPYASGVYRIRLAAYEAISPARASLTLSLGHPVGSNVRTCCANALCVRPEHLYDEDVGMSPLQERAAFWSRVNRNGPTQSHMDSQCWEWIGAKSGQMANPYGSWGNSESRTFPQRRAHRAAWEFERGEIPEGMYLCHKCDFRLCVRPDHMFVGTATDNARDMVAKKRHPQAQPSWPVRGERSPKAKLKAEDIPVIRKLAESVRISVLAREYGVSWQTMACVVRRQTWQHIP